MNHAFCTRIAVTMTVLLGLSWLTFLSAPGDSGLDRRYQAIKHGELPTHSRYTETSAAESRPEGRAFRLGISPEFPPFSRGSGHAPQ
ncbi:MAG: hypothetical protein HQL95_09470 [Magnetococcales bacterium]|nr:hypothetical protein [Magnetococcales bacterium]